MHRFSFDILSNIPFTWKYQGEIKGISVFMYIKKIKMTVGASTSAISATWVYCIVIYCGVHLPGAGIYTVSHLGAYLLLMGVACSQPLLVLHCLSAAARGSGRLQPQLPAACGQRPSLKPSPMHRSLATCLSGLEQAALYWNSPL